VSQVEKRNPQSEFRNPQSGGVFPLLGRSLRAKLLVAFLALAIFPMSASSYYNLSHSQSEVAETARENLAEISRGTARHVEQLLIENQRTSATLAGEPLAAEFLAASGEERQALAPRVHLMLQNFADTHPDYDAPGLLDVNGIVLASLEEGLLGKDRSFRDYFQASIQGEPYISDILVGRATGRPGVFLSNPVRTAEGEITGSDIVWLKTDTIWSIVDDTTVGEEGICYLVDQDGVIVAHPDQDLLYHSLGELAPEAVATITDTIRFSTIEGTDTPLVPESLGMDELAAMLTAARGSGTLQYQSPLDMSSHVAGYTRLEAVPWTVVVDIPEAQFLAPMKRLSSIAWLNMGLLALVAVGISILLARSITHPVRRLTEAAAAVERDQPFEPQDIEDVTRGGDEIGRLGRTFSNMVLSLRGLQRKLQEELAERKRAEERLEHLTLVLRAIRNINQFITRERDRDRLLQGICSTLTETRGYFNAWIGLLDENGRLLAHAEAGLGKEFLPMAERLKRGEPTACGRRALGQENAVVTEDPSVSCTDCPLSGRCAGRGAVTIRLEYGAKVYGLLSASVPASFATDEEELSLFKEASQDIAFALRSIELEEARKKTEAELQKHREHLEEMVEERTRELKEAQEELLRKEKLAVLGQLAGGMGHELRNPLGVMANAVYFLKATLPEAGETTRNYLDILDSEVRNADKIITDLLDYARSRPAEREEVAVSELVARALDRYPPPEGVEVSTEISPDLPPVSVDPAQIGQVLNNLISNAYQAMPEGGKLTISADAPNPQSAIRNPQSVVRIRVSDSGCGISKENISKIFEPLFSTRARGIGLGLAVSRNLVEANGGSITVQSQEGKGSSFTVVLPTREAAV